MNMVYQNSMKPLSRLFWLAQFYGKKRGHCSNVKESSHFWMVMIHGDLLCLCKIQVMGVDFDKKFLIGRTKILFVFIYNESMLTNNITLPSP